MTLLEGFKVMDTASLNEARQIVGRSFCSHKLEVVKSGGLFHARHHVAPGRLFSLNYLSYGETVLVEPGELEHFYLLQIPLSGHADIANGGAEFVSGIRHAAVLNPDRHTRMVWHAGCAQLLVYVPRAELTQLAERYLGRELTHPIVFQPHMDFENPDLAALRRSALILAEGADRGHVFGQAKALNQGMLEERFLTELLRHQPSNILHLVASTETIPAPRHARRARDFIIENAGSAICLQQVADAAGVPIRTLQHQFSHFYGLSPIEMLKRERLYRINSELGSGHTAEPVAAVASRWGFSHFGRFARHYKSQFGELPSTTKARARKSRSVS